MDCFKAKMGRHKARKIKPVSGVIASSGVKARQEKPRPKCVQSQDQDTQCTGNARGRAGTQMLENKTGVCKSWQAGPGGEERWSPAASSLAEGKTGVEVEGLRKPTRWRAAAY